ncbi:MAG TPA: hypothetical protein VGK61_05965 [Planctomycetota bacterium]|jgi:hypothetical protein
MELIGVIDQIVRVMEGARIWPIHMLVVFVTAFILAPRVRKAPVVVVASTVAGVLFLLVAVTIERTDVVYLSFGATMYWIFPMAAPGEFWLIRANPFNYFVPLAMCWIMPILIALITVRWRGRKKEGPAIHPQDDDDESAPHTAA